MQQGAHLSPFRAHFDGKRFFNPDAPQARGFRDVLRWKLTSHPEPSTGFVSDVTPSRPSLSISGPKLHLTFVNHSTVLLQQSGCTVLTDPIWSERASPLSWAGARRLRAPGIDFEDLPPIDVVLLSHNHYDHLDLATLHRLNRRSETQFVVPLGVKRLLESQSIGPVHERDWGQSVALADLTVHAVPAMHFSARGLFDRNRTLWCGYFLETPARTIYFAGDTAFGNHFEQIRHRCGSPDVALLPIGAYEPRWFMSSVHMGPDEAIRAHQILGAKTSVAIHHGTFQLADEGIDTPRKRFEACGPGDSFLAPHNGESVILP